METQMEKSRRSDICSIDVDGASNGKHLRSTRIEEILRIIPPKFFLETSKLKPKTF